MPNRIPVSWIVSLGLIVIMGILWFRLQTVTAQRDSARLQVTQLDNKITDQNAAISQWQSKASLQVRRLTQAQLLADKQADEYQRGSQALLQTVISARCDKAVQWGAIEAQFLAKLW
jgi:hypothetical protein